MVLNIPGGEFLTGSLDVISQSLTIPVLIILLVIVIISRLFIKMDSVSLLGWMIYAIKNVILTIFAYSIVLFVFYRENIRLLLAKIKK